MESLVKECDAAVTVLKTPHGDPVPLDASAINTTTPQILPSEAAAPTNPSTWLFMTVWWHLTVTYVTVATRNSARSVATFSDSVTLSIYVRVDWITNWLFASSTPTKNCLSWVCQPPHCTVMRASMLGPFAHDSQNIQNYSNFKVGWAWCDWYYFANRFNYNELLQDSKFPSVQGVVTETES